jgi:hypothetical protein
MTTTDARKRHDQTEAERPTTGLTDAEQRAMRMTAELFDLFAQEIVGYGPSRDADLGELAGHIHNIQHTVMAQAAARAHPSEYRLLGRSLAPAVRAEEES